MPPAGVHAISASRRRATLGLKVRYRKSLTAAPGENSANLGLLHFQDILFFVCDDGVDPRMPSLTNSSAFFLARSTSSALAPPSLSTADAKSRAS